MFALCRVQRFIDVHLPETVIEPKLIPSLPEKRHSDQYVLSHDQENGD